jgi:hypothetical protein
LLTPEQRRDIAEVLAQLAAEAAELSGRIERVARLVCQPTRVAPVDRIERQAG